MAKYDQALKRLQKARVEVSSKIPRTESFTPQSWVDLGFVSGIEKAEEILLDLQEQSRENGYKLWYTGSPNDLRSNNRGTYILIMRANFDSEDGIKNGHIYIDSDYWDGNDWESLDFGENGWELLYFTKLKWLMFPLPKSLGVKRSDDLFMY